MRAAIWLRLLVRVLWLLLGAGTAIAALAAVRGVFAPGDWMYSDGTQLYQVLRVRDGLPIYSDVAEAPFIALLYWPLYLLIAGLLSRLMSLDTYGALYLTRTLTVVGTVVAAGSVAGLASACGARRGAAVVAAGLFLTAYVVHPWAYAARADLPALGLVLLGLLVLGRRSTTGGAAMAGLLMAAGFASKQTYVDGVAVATMALLWRRQWRRAMALDATWVGCLGLTAIVLDVWSGGRFFPNTVASNAVPFRLQTIADHARMYIQLSLSLLVLGALGWQGTAAKGTAIGLVRLYAVVAAITGLASLARAGSYYNYLLELTAVLAVLGGVGFERCLAALDRLNAPAGRASRPRTSALVSVLVLTVAVSGLGLPVLTVAFKASDPPDRSALIEALRESPGLVLTEKDGLAVVLAGKDPVGGDPFGVALRATQGQWDPAPLNELVRSGSFALVALNHPVEEVVAYDDFQWWPPGTRELIQEEYRLDHTLPGYYLYVPNSAGDTATGASVPTPPGGQATGGGRPGEAGP